MKFPSLEKQHIDSVVQLSLAHVENGGVPFAALVVDEKGDIVSQGVNRVNENVDPTAHAEIEAIRAACSKLNTTNLSRKVMYASGEPCALCCLAARWVGITTIYVASDQHEAAIAGFDYRWSYNFFKEGKPSAPMKIKKLTVDNANTPFKRWNEKVG